MSVYYDLYASGNPQKKDEQQPLHARVIPSGTLNAKKFIELVSKSNGFSQATIEGLWKVLVRVPFGPFTVRVWPSSFTSTPAGITTGFLPIRDILVHLLTKQMQELRRRRSQHEPVCRS